ncbi:MAG: thioredoxin family protein, partial [Flavobacteriaceae bacterium]
METQTVTIIEDTIKEALISAISYSEYSEQMLDFFENKKTSGPEQTDALIAYTALNYQRMKRL